MSELTDDQLDGLFRKSAEEFDPAFDPAVWQEMNARLDAHDQTKPNGTATWKNLLRWGLPILLLLLFMVGGWYVYRPMEGVVTPALPPTAANSGAGVARIDNRAQSVIKSRSKKEKGEESEASAESKRFLVPRSTESNTDATRQDVLGERKTSAPKNLADRVKMLPKAVVGTDAPVAINSVQDKAVTPKPVTELKRKAVEFVSVAPAIRKTAPFVTHLASVIHPENRVTIPKRRPVTAHPALMTFPGDTYAARPMSSLPVQPVEVKSGVGVPDTQTAGTESTTTEKNEDRAVSLPGLTKLTMIPAAWSRPALLIERPVAWQAGEHDVRRLVSQAYSPRGLSVRFVVSPDLSAVGLKNFARPGTNVGLLLEYRLASRWSVQAGIMQSTKVYKASTTDYTLPDYVKTWIVQPEGVDGRCRMFDIPINLRYDVAIRPRPNGQVPSRWFVSGGVTSYVMQQEDYTYQYADPTNTHIYPKNRQWSGSTGAYGFSELNLSVGYEQAISRRLSWQIEPYLKIPLRGVGYYTVNLLSTGGFFSLRYKF